LEAKSQYHYFFPEDDLAHKFNPAGPNHESIAALVGIADYFDILSEHHFETPADNFAHRSRDLYELFANHEETLAKQLLDFIESKKQIRLIGRTGHEKSLRVPTFSFQIDGVPSASVPPLVAQDNVAISAGHFYAKRFLDSMELEDKEVVRCSMAHYNTSAEVEQLIQALGRL